MKIMPIWGTYESEAAKILKRNNSFKIEKFFSKEKKI